MLSPVIACLMVLGTPLPAPQFEGTADARTLRTFRVEGLSSPASGTVYPAEAVTGWDAPGRPWHRLPVPRPGRTAGQVLCVQSPSGPHGLGQTAVAAYRRKQSHDRGNAKRRPETLSRFTSPASRLSGNDASVRPVTTTSALARACVRGQNGSSAGRSRTRRWRNPCLGEPSDVLRLRPGLHRQRPGGAAGRGAGRQARQAGRGDRAPAHRRRSVRRHGHDPQQDLPRGGPDRRAPVRARLGAPFRGRRAAQSPWSNCSRGSIT